MVNAGGRREARDGFLSAPAEAAKPDQLLYSLLETTGLRIAERGIRVLSSVPSESDPRDTRMTNQNRPERNPYETVASSNGSGTVLLD